MMTSNSKILFFLFCLLFFIPKVKSQQTAKKTKFFIPSGEVLYSQETNNVEELNPYRKEYKEFFDNEETKIIEVGDYKIRETVMDGVLQKDTLYFAVTTYTINGLDTVKSTKKLELRKIAYQAIDANLHFTKDKIYVTIPPKDKLSTKYKTKKTIVNISDRHLYFKLDPGEKFSFNSRSFGAGFMTIPIKSRFASSSDSLLNSANLGFNNLEFFFGFKTGWHKYESGKFKNTILNIGPYFGPSVIKLNGANTENTIIGEVLKIGWTAGVTLLIGSENINFGIALGFDTLTDGKTLNWVHQNDLYFGFVIGYGFNNSKFDIRN